MEKEVKVLGFSWTSEDHKQLIETIERMVKTIKRLEGQRITTSKAGRGDLQNMFSTR